MNIIFLITKYIQKQSDIEAKQEQSLYFKCLHLLHKYNDCYKDICKPSANEEREIEVITLIINLLYPMASSCYPQTQAVFYRIYQNLIDLLNVSQLQEKTVSFESLVDDCINFGIANIAVTEKDMIVAGLISSDSLQKNDYLSDLVMVSIQLLI